MSSQTSTQTPPPPLPPLQLQYARQPKGSIASCQYRGDGGVIIVIPPMLQRTIGKVALAIECACIILGSALWVAAVAGPLRGYPGSDFFGSVLVLPALGGLAVTLWMGFRWTIIEAGPEGLRLELRGLLWTRRRFIERDRIGALRQGVSIRVVDAYGRSLGRIDATNRAEDTWVREILTRALAIPPPLPR